MKVLRLLLILIFVLTLNIQAQRKVQDFDSNWSFFLGDAPNAESSDFNGAFWRKVNLPHDWSVEGALSKVLTKEIKTAGAPARIALQADRSAIKADGKNLSFVTVKVLDKDGNIVPNADNLVNFTLSGQAFIAGVDNGDPISHDSFKASYRKAFHGLALAIIQSKTTPGTIALTATSAGFQSASINIKSN